VKSSERQKTCLAKAQKTQRKRGRLFFASWRFAPVVEESNFDRRLSAFIGGPFLLATVRSHDTQKQGPPMNADKRRSKNKL